MWELIAGGIKGLGDTVLGFIREFHMDPEQAAALEQKIRQAVMDYQLQTQQLVMQDRNSARQREMAVKDKTPAVIAYAVLFIFGLANWYVFTHTLPAGNETLISRVLGTMDMAVGLILGYYYGSSAGSAAKHTMIDKLTDGK